MTMVITKFNKLIANKFVWIGFTVLIVVAFVAWDMSVPEDARDPSERQAAGTLHGEPISPERFRNAYRHTYMGLILSIGQPVPIDEELDEEITDAAWKRIASLMKAQELGIRIGNREVVNAIQSFPDFQQNGQFSPGIYQSFTQQYLPALGFSPSEFEEHVRQELALQKLQRMVTESILIAPSEVDRAINTLGDTFTVQYALIDANVLGEGLSADDVDVEAYFEANQENFRIPPMVDVDFVRFAIADFAGDIEVTEEQALDYYDLNIDEFEVVDEQETEEAEDDDIFQVTRALPFEEVKQEIMDRLRLEQAARRAADRATDFVIGLVPDRDGLAATFEELAETYDLAIERSGPFRRGQFLPGIDAGRAFTDAAFDLRRHPEYYFSDAVVGQEYVYVLSLVERISSRLPELDEVREEAEAAALQAAIADTVADLAEAFRQAVEEGLAAGDSFAEVAELFEVPINESVTFTAADGLPDIPYGNDLVRAVLTHNQGEVTEPEFVGDGHLVVYLEERVAADPMQFADFRPQIVGSLSQERGRVLYREWQRHLLAEANFTPRAQPVREADDLDFGDDFDEDWE